MEKKEKTYVENRAMNKAELGAKQAVEVCAGVKPGDKVVVVKDKPTASAAAFVEEAIRNADGQLQVFLLEDFGKRPVKIPQKVLDLIKNSDVAFICSQYISQELTTVWQPLRSLVNKSDVRLLAMIDLDECLLIEGMNADYRKVREFSNKVYQAVENSRIIRVKTKLGSDFALELGHKWIVLNGFPEPGKWVNLPDGEVLTAPKSVDGRVVIDGVIEEFDQPRFGLLRDYPISVILKDGYAVKGSIECKNSALKRFLESNIFGQDKNASRVGEFAFGTNIDLKRLIGNLTQDEKFPSVHIAFGDPAGEMTGAPWTSKIHMDAIILKPTVWVDEKIIMRDGKHLL